MTIQYTSEDPRIMAYQAALAAIDGYLCGRPNEEDMAEAHDRLQAVLADAG